MATSGSFNGGNTFGSAHYYAGWSLQSQDVTNNTSTISWYCGYHFQGNDCQLDNGNLVINGSDAWRNSGRIKNYEGNFTTRDYQMASGTRAIQHNADGTKNFSMSGSVVPYQNSASSGSGSWDLPTIPRASAPTISANNIEIGASTTINTNRASSSFIHTIALTFGSFTKTLATGVGASWAWPTGDDATNLAAQIGTAGSVAGTITLTTFNGSTNIGSKTVAITIKATPTTPTISANNFEVGGSTTVGTARASSNYTHDISLTFVSFTKTLATAQATSWAWNTANDAANLYAQIGTTGSKAGTITCVTKCGSTTIGTKTVAITIKATGTTATLSASSVQIGNSVTANLTRTNTNATTKVTLIVGSYSVVVASAATGNVTINTDSYASSLYAQTPNSNSVAGTVRVETIGGSTTLKTVNLAITLTVANSAPTFSNFTYSDTNSTVSAITGNNQLLLQNKSSLSAVISSADKAVAKNSATMSNYTATITGLSVAADYNSAGQTIAVGTVGQSGTQRLNLIAKDSRGNTTTAYKDITVIPYNNPVINASVTRLNGFEAQTTLTVKGSIAPITVSGTQKNAIVAASGCAYRYKDSSTSTWAAWINIPLTLNGANYQATNNITLSLDNTKSWNFEVRSVDKLVTSTVSLTLSVGLPIMFLDAENRNVGIGRIPSSAFALDVMGQFRDGYETITTAVDLNSYTTMGKYLIKAAPSLNGPLFGAWFMLEVSRPIGISTNDVRVIQTATKDNASMQCFRVWNGATWSSWTALDDQTVGKYLPPASYWQNKIIETNASVAQYIKIARFMNYSATFLDIDLFIGNNNAGLAHFAKFNVVVSFPLSKDTPGTPQVLIKRLFGDMVMDDFKISVNPIGTHVGDYTDVWDIWLYQSTGHYANGVANMNAQRSGKFIGLQETSAVATKAYGNTLVETTTTPPNVVTVTFPAP